MRTRNPDNRYRSVKAATERPEHVLDAALWDLLHRGATANKTVMHAHEIWANPYEREIMQAFLLAGADDALLDTHLRLPPSVTQAYRHLFFDRNMFRDELDVMSWVRDYQGTPEGTKLLHSAMENGVEVVAWICGYHIALDAQTVQQRIMLDSFARSRSHRGNSLSSKEVAVAHSLMKTAASQAEKLSKRGSGAGLNELILKLRHRDMTSPVNEIPKDDLLH